MRGIKGRGLEEGNGERGWRFVITFRGELFVGEIVNCCVGIHTHTHTHKQILQYTHLHSKHTHFNKHTLIHKKILQHTHSHNKHTHLEYLGETDATTSTSTTKMSPDFFSHKYFFQLLKWKKKKLLLMRWYASILFQKSRPALEISFSY